MSSDLFTIIILINDSFKLSEISLSSTGRDKGKFLTIFFNDIYFAFHLKCCIVYKFSNSLLDGTMYQSSSATCFEYNHAKFNFSFYSK